VSDTIAMINNPISSIEILPVELLHFLESILEKSNLRKLEFDLEIEGNSEVSWS